MYSNSQDETNLWIMKIQTSINGLNEHDVQDHIGEESIRLLQKREEEVEEMQQEIKQKRLTIAEQKKTDNLNKQREELARIQ